MSGPEDANELKSFEARLANLAPREDRLDREKLMFLMGQASERTGSEPSRSPSLKGRGNVRAWQAAFGGMSAIAATLMCMLVMRPVENGLARSGDAAARHVELSPPKAELNGPSDDGMRVLVVRDAYSGDIEGRLLRLSTTSGATDIPAEQSKRPALTPAGWRRVFDSNTSEASGAGSSAMPRDRRTHV
jgi:hypothetical protein